MVRVKVCGMQTPQDIAVCLRAGVDALGFIFANSPRRLTPVQAGALTELVPPFIAKVGVFAHNAPDLIRDALARCGFDFLQFSGGESAAFCGSFGKPTIVVIRHPAGEPPTVRDLERARAAALMIDNQTHSKNGGTGKAVRQAIARDARRNSPLPFILAGGLTPHNVADAVAAISPWAVDVRSGVERNGRKDPVLVRQFVTAAKGARS